MKRLLTFILTIFLFAACVKSKFADKGGASGTLFTQPRSVTCCAVNINTATSTKIWGVNGHPTNQAPYWGNIDAQLNLIQEMGMNQYRMDMGVDRNGEFPPENLSRFNELMTKSEQRGITVLPVLITHEWWPSNYTRDDAYYVGHLMGSGFASRYGSHFHVYELGNEEEGYSLKYNVVGKDTSYWAGEAVDNYFPDLLDKTIYYINGLIEGVRAIDPTAKVVINASSHHFGFIQALVNRGVRFDIIGYHWYFETLDTFKRILDSLNNFHKDVWFTEFDRFYGSRPPAGLQQPEGFNQQSDYVYTYLNELELRTFVKAVFPYELFDQDGPDSTQSMYGLVYWTTPFNFTAYTKKPVVATWKYEIEENLHGNEDYVYSFFLYCNDRVPDPGGLQYWTNRLTTTGNRQELITVGYSQEANGRFAEEQYEWLLDEPSMSTDLWNYWLNRMQTGATREQVICELCASDEFWTKSGSTVDGYVERLFNKLLRRPSDPGGKTSWVNAINGGTSRYQAANVIIHQQEYYGKFIDEQFRKLLRRNGPTEQSAIDYYTSKLMNGWIQADMINTLLMSDEYWYRGINEGYLRRFPGYPVN